MFNDEDYLDEKDKEAANGISSEESSLVQILKEIDKPHKNSDGSYSKLKHSRFFEEAKVEEETDSDLDFDLALDTKLTIEDLLDEVEEHDGSDLHLVVGSKPKMRVRGELVVINNGYKVLNAETAKEMISDILSKEDIEEFDRTGDLDLAYSPRAGKRYRANIFKQKGSWAAVFRVISNTLLPLETLGLPQAVIDATMSKKGLILITGPTGSGKSTTLSVLLDNLNSTFKKHIVTIEDPIEYSHSNKLSNISQREVGSDTVGFKEGLRAALREDPDIIMVGEMRDTATIETAMTAAETGHVVLSTLHTNSASDTINRILDSFPADKKDQIKAQLASTLICCVSQQRMPRASGKGMVCAYEVMITTTAIRSMIKQGKIDQLDTNIQQGKSAGMLLMADAIRNLLSKGIINNEVANEFMPEKDRK